MKIRPLHDRVVIKRKEEERLSPEYRDSRYAKEKPIRGEVLAVGNGKILQDGRIIPLDVRWEIKCCSASTRAMRLSRW